VSATAERFAVLCRRLGARGDASQAAADLLRRWAEPDRAYHNLDHLRHCLARLDDVTVVGAGADPDLVEAALWFHDAVYDARSADNEARSAELAREALAMLGVPDETARRVAALVLLTRHREPPTEPEGRLLCDIDLSILGESADDFERYDQAIRREYAWVPDPIYRRERAAVLRGLLERQPLYATPHLRERYEQPARANLQRALARLGDS
jgi:predicted metal-dependent HD superfamily phosphohydrolase